MASFIFANNATSTLAASLSDTATTLDVAVGEGALFPDLSHSYPSLANERFPVTLEDASGNLEIVYCTERSGDTFTVIRGQEGTTARAFAAGDKIELRATAASLLQTPEIGTFDFHLNFSGANTDNVYYNRTFHYTKRPIGVSGYYGLSEVFITGQLYLQTKGIATGSAALSGLPFNAYIGGTGDFRAHPSFRLIDISHTGFVSGFAQDDIIELHTTDTAGNTDPLTDTDFTDGSLLGVTLTYLTTE